MEIFGFTITRTKAYVAPIRHTDSGWRVIYESFAGAWQRNITKEPKDILTHSAVYACVSLIASDIGKLRLKLVERDDDGIWTETERSAFSPVLQKPNRYQTRQKFIEHWVHSKLIHGNTYVWKERDQRQVVVALYVLDPRRVRALVAPDGSVFYQIGNDNLAAIQENSIQVPASEIIHDVMSALYHPLCGVSPITACALPACHGLNIQEHSAKFFANAANPGGILTATGHIPQETAEYIKKQWEERYSGQNIGRVVVAGDGLDYKPIGITALQSQLIEQLKWTAEQVCTCFHIPPYMIGVGPPPNYNNIEALNAQYYAQCLQTLIEAIEALLDEGLGFTANTALRLGTEFDLDDLLRMDAKSAAEMELALLKGIKTTNEARKRFGLKPVKGGDDVRAQEQDHSLEALANRDALDDPFGTAKPAPAALPPPENDDDESDEDDDDVTRDFIAAINRKFDEARLAA